MTCWNLVNWSEMCEKFEIGLQEHFLCKVSNRFSRTVISIKGVKMKWGWYLKIGYSVFALHRDQPQAWELSVQILVHL